MRRFLRRPALHWVVLGALLFLFGPSAGTPQRRRPAAARAPIVITASELAQLEALYQRETGLALTDSDERALLEREIRDRLLYREALAHGLLRHDRSIRWRLASKMRFLSASGEPDQEESAGQEQADVIGADDETLYRDALALGLDRDDVVVKRILIHKMRLLIRLQADADVPDEATLRSYFEAHAADYVQPPHISFTHVFASGGKRGGRAESDLRELLNARGSNGATPRELVGRGDSFPLGHRYRSRSRAAIAKVFGQAFADAVLDAEPGRWSGPFESAYGWHLVWIDEKQGERVPELASVRSQVRQRYVDEHRNAHLEQTLARLRDEYEIVIERDRRADGDHTRDEV